MKSFFGILLGLALLASVGGVVVQWKTIEKLRQDNQRLDKENDELFRFGKDQIDVEIGKREKELAQLRTQMQELPRLRGEVTQLTRQVAYTESTVTDTEGAVVSRAMATFIVRRKDR